MTKDKTILKEQPQTDIVKIEQFKIERLIYVIRDKQVMIDSDLAVLYQLETDALNRAVKRIGRGKMDRT